MAFLNDYIYDAAIANRLRVIIDSAVSTCIKNQRRI